MNAHKYIGNAALSCILALAINCFGAAAAIAAHPSTVLTVSGNIAPSDGESADNPRVVEFDLAQLESFRPETIRTHTPWTDGLTEFIGVRVSELLEFVGARSDHLTLIGLDGYSYDVKTIDFERYPILIAYKKNREYMSIRELGPLWFMFPFDDYPELLNENNKAGAVWQLSELVVR